MIVVNAESKWCAGCGVGFERGGRKPYLWRKQRYCDVRCHSDQVRGVRVERRSDADSLRDARAMRVRGMTWQVIGKELGRSPAWLSLNLPDLAHIPAGELAARRAADHTVDPAAAVREYRASVGEAWRVRMAAAEIESRAMARLENDWHWTIATIRVQRRIAARKSREVRLALDGIDRRARSSLQAEWTRSLAQARERLREAEREARRLERERAKALRLAAIEAEREARRAARARARLRKAWSPTTAPFNPIRPVVFRLDAATERDEGAIADRHALSAPMHDPNDPQTFMESQELDAIVGNLTIADIQRMTDDELGPLRERLIAAGYAPRGAQASERKRLQDPVRHRGEAPPAKRAKPHYNTNKSETRKQRVEGSHHRRPKRKPRTFRDVKPVYDWKAAA